MGFNIINITSGSELHDILVAELVEIGYDSFEEHSDSLSAYILIEQYDAALLEVVLHKYHLPQADVRELEDKNWNEVWESNFPLVEISDDCVIRATFHTLDRVYKHEIVIDPKMAFGTGHHSTTALMLQAQMRLDHTGKSILDAGSGTGILAILAEQLGAATILAYDNDIWSYNNIVENTALNNCTKIKALQGVIATIPAPAMPYDIILANINRNVLLEEIPSYVSQLKDGGYLLLSGFYNIDMPMMLSKTSSQGLTLVAQDTRLDWMCLVLQK